jgi:hypothetical protein
VRGSSGGGTGERLATLLTTHAAATMDFPGFRRNRAQVVIPTMLLAQSVEDLVEAEVRFLAVRMKTCASLWSDRDARKIPGRTLWGWRKRSKLNKRYSVDSITFFLF